MGERYGRYARVPLRLIDGKAKGRRRRPSGAVQSMERAGHACSLAYLSQRGARSILRVALHTCSCQSGNDHAQWPWQKEAG